MAYKTKIKKVKSQQYEDYILYGDKERDEELAKGMKVEKEHYPTYRKLEAYHKKTGKCMPKEKFAEDIAKDHIREDPKYYDKLQKAKL